jgi:hypothetical protein
MQHPAYHRARHGNPASPAGPVAPAAPAAQRPSPSLLRGAPAPVETRRPGPAAQRGGAPLTAWGVAVVLLGACLTGAVLDLLLVGTVAWATTSLFVAGCGYAAAKVRRADWYSAVVGPPLAFAAGLLLVAQFSPHDLGQGLTAVCATILELLALNSPAVFTGTVLAAAVTLVRRYTLQR